MDAGSVVHKLILGRGADIEVVDVRYGERHKQAGERVKDWATEAAKAAREAARAAGKIPVLALKYPIYNQAAATAIQFMEAHPECHTYPGEGRAELTMIAEHDGIWFKALADWCPHDQTLPLLDVKTTEWTAAPAVFAKRIQSEYAFQDAFYRRVRRMITGITTPPARFIVVELDPPHGISMVTPDPELCRMADYEVSRAIMLWTDCMRRDAWPSYPMVLTEIGPARWQVLEHEQELIDEAIREGTAYVPRHRRLGQDEDTDA
jgi:hypothetical protein